MRDPNHTIPSASKAVSTTDLTKFFGRRAALRTVDLEVDWGSILVLLGHNGAGKSTLLRILATLARADEGNVKVAGIDVNADAATARKRIGYVGHSHLLYEELSAAENLLFYAAMFGVDSPRLRVESVLESVGGLEWKDRPISKLSNGMKKRITLARSLIHQPPVLLLDEADTGLDPIGIQLLGTVVRSVRQSGASVILTTHDVSLGLEMADYVAVLSAGRIILEGESSGFRSEQISSVIASGDSSL